MYCQLDSEAGRRVRYGLTLNKWAGLRGEELNDGLGGGSVSRTFASCPTGKITACFASTQFSMIELPFALVLCQEGTPSPAPTKAPTTAAPTAAPSNVPTKVHENPFFVHATSSLRSGVCS